MLSSLIAKAITMPGTSAVKKDVLFYKRVIQLSDLHHYETTFRKLHDWNKPNPCQSITHTLVTPNEVHTLQSSISLHHIPLHTYITPVQQTTAIIPQHQYPHLPFHRILPLASFWSTPSSLVFWCSAKKQTLQHSSS